MNANGGEEHLFSVHLESVPLRVVADRKGKFFAIIMQRATGLKKKTQKPESHKQGTFVFVYAKSDSGSSEPSKCIGDFGMKQSLIINDVCFYHFGLKHFLVIAVENRLVLLDYKDKCKKIDDFQLGRMLPNTEPLIPTALATDRSGKMWIGCKGGVVLCWMLIAELSKLVSLNVSAKMSFFRERLPVLVRDLFAFSSKVIKVTFLYWYKRTFECKKQNKIKSATGIRTRDLRVKKNPRFHSATATCMKTGHKNASIYRYSIQKSKYKTISY
jgi:hypothetical protein